MARDGVLGFDIFLLVLAIAGYIIPINDPGWTAPETNDLCAFDLGNYSAEMHNKHAHK